jgi:hypothetical protein
MTEQLTAEQEHFLSYAEVQLERQLEAAFEAELTDRLIALLAVQFELNELVRDYIATHGEAGRLWLREQLGPTNDRLENYLRELMEEINNGQDTHAQ